MEDGENRSVTHFSKVVYKKDSNGRILATYTLESKSFSGNKFVQITQDKMPFGQQPAKRSWITFDPSSKEVWKALEELQKSANS